MKSKAKPLIKKRILLQIKQAVDEVKLHKNGKLKLKTAKEFLNEL
jgi:hypothetical protein